MITTLLLSWRALIVNNPYIMAAMFGQVLILICCIIGSIRKFIGFVLFIVYVGGIIILIRYCVILSISQKFYLFPFIPGLLGLGLTWIGGPNMPVSSTAYGLLFRASACLLIALLLYLVMLSVVAIVDYSRGIIK